MRTLELLNLSPVDRELLMELLEAAPETKFWGSDVIWHNNKNPGDFFQLSECILARERTHDKPGQRFEIVSTEMIGYGGQAALFHISGTIAVDSQTLRVKTNKQRLVKIYNENTSLGTEYKVANVAEYMHMKAPVNIGKTTYVVMKHLPGRPLDKILADDFEGIHILTYKERKKIILSLVKALKNLHDRGIIHRDIKPENIMIDEEMNATIIDFGLSRFDKEEDFEFPGTVGFAAPEVHMGISCDQKSDTYSLAKTIECILNPNVFQKYQEPDDLTPKAVAPPVLIPCYEAKVLKETLNNMTAVSSKERYSLEKSSAKLAKLDSKYRLRVKKWFTAPYYNRKLQHQATSKLQPNDEPENYAHAAKL